MKYGNHKGTSYLILPCPSSLPWAHVSPPRFISSTVHFLDVLYCPRKTKNPVKSREQEKFGFNKGSGWIGGKKVSGIAHSILKEEKTDSSRASECLPAAWVLSLNNTPEAEVPRMSQSLCLGKRNLCLLESLHCCVASCSWLSHLLMFLLISARPDHPG